MQYPTAESIDCPGLLARMHPRVEALVVVETHRVGLRDAAEARAAGIHDSPLHIGHRAALLARNSDAGVFELLEVDLALAAVLDLIEDDVHVGRLARLVKELCVLAELVELPAVKEAVTLAEVVEGLLNVAPGQLALLVVVEPVRGRQQRPPAIKRSRRAGGGPVVVVGPVGAGVQGLVVVEAHAVGLRRRHVHARLLPLRDGRLNKCGGAALLLCDAADAVLELLEGDGVLASGLVLCEEEAGVGPLELPVEELAVAADLREVPVLELLVAASVCLEDVLAGVPEGVVLLGGVHRSRGREPRAPALTGPGRLRGFRLVDVVHELVKVDGAVPGRVHLVEELVRRPGVQALHQHAELVEVQLVVAVLVEPAELGLELLLLPIHAGHSDWEGGLATAAKEGEGGQGLS
mmetsp:Transcript_16531/g.37230  ORF Transcript_16531/g.37230 Transcript_16531/m.37230 type:complete len:407 (-) Transcript_16531:15-1235(-)